MMLKYLSALFAIILLGNIADVPVMFLGVRGELSLYFVFIAGFCVDILSDLFWYWVGIKIGTKGFEKVWFLRGKEARITAMGKALENYGLLLLFSSKFITTLGIPAQIVAGAHRYPLKKMLLANVLGAGSLLIAVYSLAVIFASDVVTERYLKNVNIAFFVFLIVIVVLHYFIAKPMNRILSSKNRIKSDSSSDGNI